MSAPDSRKSSIFPRTICSRRRDALSWPRNALRAQAVAARSYALTAARGGTYDLFDDARDQVYGGKDTETAAGNAAARHTKLQVVRYSGGIFPARRIYARGHRFVFRGRPPGFR